MPEDEPREAKTAELRKLMEFGAFEAVRMEEARGKQCFPFKWVDKRKDGVAKSRFTIADV